MVTTIAALAALWFTSQSLRATSEQAGLARQTAITDRFAKAVEQLGNTGSMDIRLGGIQLLRKLAEDSEADRAPIYQMLGAFVRSHAPNRPDCGTDNKQLDIDVQAALTVIGSRGAGRTESIDLSNTCLARADLTGASLQNVKFRDVNLSKAYLQQADMRSAQVISSNLTKVNLSEANLSLATIMGGTLENAVFLQTNLTKVTFSGVDLRKADLGTVDLAGAILFLVDLRGANLGTGFKMVWPSIPLSDLETSEYVSMRGASLRSARFDEETNWPPGFQPQSKPYMPRRYADYCPQGWPEDC
ncbi:pentapeptide repeat-containing protein [Nocardia sp. NPDC051832]|uniref:pentapeptide repeat-containing protein n=1 Tax=Nocardia sp. NPDC051832 TaxID=3155673 RepID=UPI003414A53A